MKRIALLIVLGIATAACTSSDPRVAPDDDRPVIAVTLDPIADLTRSIVGDAARVVQVVPPGVDPHDASLAPDDIEALRSADLVVIIGADLQPAVNDALGADQAVVDLTVVSPDHPGDPHLWLNPFAMAQAANGIALSAAAIPDIEADAVLDGVGVVAAALRELDERYAGALETCERRTIVTTHAAFGQMATRYDLTEESIAGTSPEATPDPKRLAELTDLIDRKGLTTVFAERADETDIADTLARETGATVAVLDPLETLGDRTYLEAMDENLAALVEALDCA